MKSEVKNLEKSEIEIKIEADKNDMEPFMKKASDMISKDVKVKGFRTGHVPQHVLEQYVDSNMIKKYANELALQKFYVDTVLKEKLQPISRPKVVIESEDPLIFKAIVAILPEVSVKGYEEIKIKKEDPKVEKKEVEEIIKDFLKRSTKYKEIEKEAKEGYKLEIDFEGFDENGKSVENTSSKNHPIVIGDGTMVKGFEENLIGLKKGDKKEFTVTFPKDYFKKDFQNKKMTFKVEVKKVEEPEKTELTEELIEKVTGRKMNEEEFRKDIEKNIMARKTEQAKKEQENKYIEELLKKTKVEVPKALIEEEIDFIIRDMKENVSSKGMEFEKFLEQNKIELKDLRKKYKDEAEKRVKVRLALREVIKKEDIKVSKEEVEAELKKIKSFYPEKEHKKIEEDFEKGDLKAQIENRITLRKLFEKVL